MYYNNTIYVLSILYRIIHFTLPLLLQNWRYDRISFTFVIASLSYFRHEQRVVPSVFCTCSGSGRAGWISSPPGVLHII